MTSVDLGAAGEQLVQIGLHGNRDLSELKNFSGRTFDRVDVSYTALQDLAFLGDQTEIAALYIGGEQLTELAGLRNITGLIHLEIQASPNSRPSVLTELSPLERLELRGMERLQNLDFLQSQNQLNHLTLERSYSVEDFSGLQFLSNLESARLNYLGSLDLSLLADSSNLTNIELRGNELTSIGGVSVFNSWSNWIYPIIVLRT